MLEYLLFDLDGTLTDSSEGITKSVQYGLKSVGIEVQNLEELLVFIGPPLEYSLKEFYHLNEEQVDRAREKYRERYKQVGMYENALYPGMAALLKDMKKRGKHLAVASSKPEPFVRQILKHFNIEQYFEVIVGSGLDGSLGTKEEVVQEALRKLFAPAQASGKAKVTLTKEEREKTAIIGDRRFDVEGGKANGIVTIGVEYGFADEGELKEAKADYIVRTVEELHSFLLRGSEDADERRMKSYNQAQKKKTQREEIARRKAERAQKATQGSSLRKALDVLIPLMVYFVVYDVVGIALSLLSGFAGQRIGGSVYEYMLAHVGTVRGVLVILTLLITMAALYPMSKWEFFLHDGNATETKKVIGIEKETKMSPWKKIRTAIVFGLTAISASLGLNIVFQLLHIVDMSEQYSAVAQAQSSVVMGVGIVLYGIVSPLAEETLFRGLVYNRMKQYFPKVLSMVLSALFFGLYHGNLVQGLFGVILGIVMAWLYELYGKWYVPVIFHGLVNISSYLLTALPGKKDGFVTIVNAAIFVIIWIVGMIYMGKSNLQSKKSVVFKKTML